MLILFLGCTLLKYFLVFNVFYANGQANKKYLL